MILKLVVDILTVEFRVDMCQDKIIDNVFTDHWIVWWLWFCFLMENNKNINLNMVRINCDISELKIEHKLEPELQKETVVNTYLNLPVVS